MFQSRDIHEDPHAKLVLKITKSLKRNTIHNTTRIHTSCEYCHADV